MERTHHQEDMSSNPAEHSPVAFPRQPVDDWSTLENQNVEVHIAERVAGRGRAADVMADGSILWLMPEEELPGDA